MIVLSKLIKLYTSYGGISLHINNTPIKLNFLQRGKDCELNQNQGNLRQVIGKVPRAGVVRAAFGLGSLAEGLFLLGPERSPVGDFNSAEQSQIPTETVC